MTDAASDGNDAPEDWDAIAAAAEREECEVVHFVSYVEPESEVDW